MTSAASELRTRPATASLISGDVSEVAFVFSAIIHAHASFLAVYLPHGSYLVSDTLSAYENNSLPGYPSGINNTWPCRFQPNVMLVSTHATTTITRLPWVFLRDCVWVQGARAVAGADGALTRPKILLKPHSPKFATPGKPGASRPVVDFTAINDPEAAKAQVSGINFNQLFKGIGA